MALGCIPHVGDFREDFTAYEAVFFEGAERLRERLLRYVGYLTLQFIKTHRLLVLQVVQHKERPFVAYTRKDVADRAIDE